MSEVFGGSHELNSPNEFSKNQKQHKFMYKGFFSCCKRVYMDKFLVNLLLTALTIELKKKKTVKTMHTQM